MKRAGVTFMVDGVDGTTVEAVSRLAAAVVAADPSEAECALIGGPDATRLAGVMSGKVSAVIEAADDSPDQLAQRIQGAIDPGALSLSLVSASVHELPVASLFCAWIAQHRAVPAETLSDMETAVHEAVCNALFHGNLGISSAELEKLDDVGGYFAALDAPLADPVLAARRVDIEARFMPGSVVVSVSDGGAGYDPVDKRPIAGGADERPARTGRGLPIIRSLASRHRVLDGGRTIAMTFVLPVVEIAGRVVREARSSDTVELGAFLEQARVLVVDDDLINREIVLDWLDGMGISAVEQAVDGADALEKIVAFRPSLILLDLVMPVMDGFEVMRRLENLREAEGVPVIVLTAQDDRDARNRALELGATHSISKPMVRELVTAKIGELLERQRLVEVLLEYQERVGQELELARDMQQDLVPAARDILSLEHQFGCSLESVFRPSSELGGDTWGVWKAGPGQLGLFLADFSGHGVAAAINVFRLQAAMAELRHLRHRPGDFVAAVNRRLCDLLAIGQFATLFYAVADFKTDVLVYATAASPGVFASEGADGEMTPLDGEGYLLGIKADAVFAERSVPFPPGSSLLLFSDALYETPNDEGLNLELEGVGGWANTPGVRHARRPLERILAMFDDYCAQPPNDDLTVVWLRRR